MGFLFTQATPLPSILTCSIVAALFLDRTRRGAVQPMMQNAVRPELRGTSMALTEFVNGAFASVVIILFGNFANEYGLSRTLFLLTRGFWALAFCVTPLFYLVYPKDAERLHVQMQGRREWIAGNR